MREKCKLSGLLAVQSQRRASAILLYIKGMYSLRSRNSCQKQATIDFASRKRTRASESTKHTHQLDPASQSIASSCSPPKRSREAMPVSTRSSSRKKGCQTTPSRKMAARPQRQCQPTSSSPPPSEASKENQPTTPEKNGGGAVSCDLTPSPPRPLNKTPGRTPARVVMQRLENSELAALQAVKRSLHNSLPSSLLCRETELAAMTDFIQTHLSKKRSGSLYVSGAPGTGKTACLSHILGNSPDITKAVSMVTVNCMSVKQPQAIFSRLAEGLGVGGGGRSVQEGLMEHITTSKKMILVVLDEIDQLDCRGQEILYTIFIPSMAPWCPSNTLRSSPLSIFHSRTVPSEEPV